MSKPRYHWYGIVKHMVCRYYELQDCKSMQDYVFLCAINRALDDLKTLPYGDKHLWAVEQVLFLQRYTVVGAAYSINFSEYTVQRWINKFINRVGLYAGFCVNKP